MSVWKNGRDRDRSRAVISLGFDWIREVERAVVVAAAWRDHYHTLRDHHYGATTKRTLLVCMCDGSIAMRDRATCAHQVHTRQKRGAKDARARFRQSTVELIGRGA